MKSQTMDDEIFYKQGQTAGRTSPIEQKRDKTIDATCYKISKSRYGKSVAAICRNSAPAIILMIKMKSFSRDKLFNFFLVDGINEFKNCRICRPVEFEAEKKIFKVHLE